MGTKGQQQPRAPLAAGSFRKMCLQNPPLCLTMPQSESKTPHPIFECYQLLLCTHVGIYTVSTSTCTSEKTFLKKTKKINKPHPSLLSPYSLSDFLAICATLTERVKIKEITNSAWNRLFKVHQNTLFMEDQVRMQIFHEALNMHRLWRRRSLSKWST